MILKETGYGYNDITIIPAMYSNVNSRSECIATYDNNKLPIFAAPMSSVIDDTNYTKFNEVGVTPVIPRSVNLEKRINLCNQGEWIAVSLNEYKDFIFNSFNDFTIDKIKICIDVANGHMKQIYDLCFKSKHIMHERLSLMVGNIANPSTYMYINSLKDEDGSRLIDYVRCGIGSGAGCFIDGTKIKTNDGEKNIEDINIGDKVLTIDGSYQKVLSKIRYKSNDLIKINNEITSTKNHEFFVINKSDKNLITEENLEKYGYWVEASKLDKEKHLLIKKD